MSWGKGPDGGKEKAAADSSIRTIQILPCDSSRSEVQDYLHLHLAFMKTKCMTSFSPDLEPVKPSSARSSPEDFIRHICATRVSVKNRTLLFRIASFRWDDATLILATEIKVGRSDDWFIERRNPFSALFQSSKLLSKIYVEPRNPSEITLSATKLWPIEHLNPFSALCLFFQHSYDFAWVPFLVLLRKLVSAIVRMRHVKLHAVPV